MPRLHSSAEVIRVLERNGFICVSQKGSHIKMKYTNKVVIVPANRREIPMGTFRSILRQSGLSDSDFS